MNRRTLAMILAGGVALALGGRALVRPRETSRAPVTPPVTGRVEVEVFDDGQPAAERVVVFSDAAGSLLGSTKTASDGTASGQMTARGMVTVAHGTSVRHLITVTDVAPGERILVGEEEDEGGVAHVACRVALTVPGPHPRAARTVVTVGVNDTEVADARPVALAVLDRFVVDGKVRAVARALDGEGELVAFSESFVEGCARGDAGPSLVSARLPSWSSDLRTFRLEVAAPAVGTVEATLSLVPPGSDGILLGVRKATLPGASLTFLAPRPLGTRARTKLTVTYGGAGRSTLDERRADLAETSTLDLAERLLPRLRDAVVSTGARPSIRWSASSPLAAADAIVARLAWPASREHVWTVLAPGSVVGPLVVPLLPDELAAWRPDGADVSGVVGAIDASFWNGYGDVKAKGLASLEDPPEADVVVVRTSETGPLAY